jgi:hypothetical protein
MIHSMCNANIINVDDYIPRLNHNYILSWYHTYSIMVLVMQYTAVKVCAGFFDATLVHCQQTTSIGHNCS